MSAKDAQKRRSQERAAQKRAKSKPGPRRQDAVMTPEAFRRLAAPIISEVAEKRGKSEDVVATVLEMMVDEGCLGLDANGQSRNGLERHRLLSVHSFWRDLYRSMPGKASDLLRSGANKGTRRLPTPAHR
ncbi:hypothetical protein WCLP8_3500014 [uncultured Gammaproteobacteria bacterium]